MKFDMHTHTVYSKHWFWGIDALGTPRELIKAAVKKGLSGIAITDHQTVRGGLLGLKIAKKIRNFKVIPGIEVRTTAGDIVGLNVKENIPDRMSVDETVERIHDLGGTAVAAHPFANFIFRTCVREQGLKADAIEIYNSLSSLWFADNKAKKLAKKFKKPVCAGSDAHTPNHVGRAGIICDGDPVRAILKKKVKIFGERVPMRDIAKLLFVKSGRSIKWNTFRRENLKTYGHK